MFDLIETFSIYKAILMMKINHMNIYSTDTHKWKHKQLQ